MSPNRIPTTARAGAAAVLAALGAASLLAACADDPTRPAAAAARPIVPRAGIYLIPTYTATVTDLGTLGAAADGRNESRAYGINDSGVVTGGSTRSGFTSSFDNAFRWRSATGMQYAGVRGTGHDINLGGTIVGASFRLPGTTDVQGFSVTPTNVVTPLGFMPNDYASAADAINGAGDIVGVSDEGNSHVTGYVNIGVRWDAGTLALSGYMPATTWANRWSHLYDINDARQMVGYAADAAGQRAGFRYTPGVGYELIKPWSTTATLMPQAINAAGEVAGYESSAAGTLPFRWSPALGFATLGGGTGKAFGIDGGRYAVGWSNSAPVYWKPDGTRMALPRLAGAAAVPCAEYECAAQDINNKMEIVGYDKTAGGEVHAVLWRVRITYKIVIEIWPFEPPRPIYWLRDDLIPLAVLATPEFDPREIKPGILRFGNDDGVDTPVAVGKDGTPMVSYEDVDKDGDLDLVVYFSQAAMEKNKDLMPETSVLYLTGDLGGGERLRGATKVEVVQQ